MNEVANRIEPAVFSLVGDGEIPNNPRCAALHYPGAVALGGCDPARAFEALFDRHGWPAAWRNGIFGYQHFHTSAHEALGIYSGTVQVQLGGEDGVALTAAPGDVVVVPAGVGHKQLSCSGRLGVVGAYPSGQHADLCRPDASRYATLERAVRAVPMPTTDPVYGSAGPLIAHWSSAG